MPAILGVDVQTKDKVLLGDEERRSGLYVPGKPEMGKSALLVNLILQDRKNGHGVFFLDPHGDAISDCVRREDIFCGGIFDGCVFLDPEDERYSFGINPLSRPDITSLKERVATYTKVYNVFDKLWEEEWGAWMQLVVQHALYVLIETQEYTLSEMPLFLTNADFRAHVLGKVKYAHDSVDFWRSQFQSNQAEAALTRVTTLLGHPYVKHIVGQIKTTLDFHGIMDSTSGKALLIKLSANLAPDIKKFIDTLIISELLHAVRARPEGKRKHFCIFVDEFQNFATDDFATLITETGSSGKTKGFWAPHQLLPIRSSSSSRLKMLRSLLRSLPKPPGKQRGTVSRSSFTLPTQLRISGSGGTQTGQSWMCATGISGW